MAIAKKKKSASKPFKKWHLFWIIPTGLVATFLLAVLVLPEPQYADGFRTLSEIAAYADGLDEQIDAENNNIFYPSYDRYYQKHIAQTVLKKYVDKTTLFLSMLGLIPPPAFSSNFFEAVLTKVTHKRPSGEIAVPYIQQISHSSHAKYVIFGELHGALHSLTRNLSELKKLNIIDENLRIKDQGTLFIFLGCTVTKSSFSMETLALILKLMLNNPNKIIYLRGAHEHRQAWRAQSLKKELQLRIPQSGKANNIPLENEIDSFFESLPYAFYVTLSPSQDSQELPIIKITAKIENDEIKDLLNYDNVEPFLKINTNQVMSQKVASHSSSNNNRSTLKLLASITAIKKRQDYVTMDGLRRLPPVDGAICWTVFSTPTPIAQKSMDFFYDAFVIITPSKLLEKWMITLYNRDIRNSSLKFESKHFEFFTGDQINNPMFN